MEQTNPFHKGARVYFVGIKGTGVCALAELMKNWGVTVSGVDTAEVFYTDAILRELAIPYHENFDAAHISNDFDLVVHSAAYGEDNLELAEARRRSIPIMKYPDALGLWSQAFDSAGIAGVHGKTTTTALAGVLARAFDLPAQILAGSAVSGFNGRSTLTLGNKYFIAETCEYRRHFLSFRPRRIVLTSVESDHQDYFPDYASIRDAFVEYGRLLPAGGQLIYCADDEGAREVAEILKSENRGIEFIPYGFTAKGAYRIENYFVRDERAFFTIAAFGQELSMCIPGRHQALNAAAALALCSALAENNGSGNLSAAQRQAAADALANFRGSKRRSEIIGEARGILFMDDYGHHPTAIKTTLEGLRAFYPARRIIVSFMSHTYTRTAALFEEFAACFDSADILFLHKIYASAREQYSGGINGRSLFDRVKLNMDKSRPQSAPLPALGETQQNVFYCDEPMDAFEQLKNILRSGDIFITMGAGSNWPLGFSLYDYFGGNAA